MAAPWKSIRPSERPLAGALTATYFLIIGAFTIGKIARDSLFLAELPAEYLPYMYVGLAVLSAIAAAALGRVRVGSAKLRLSFMLGGTGLSLLLFAGWFRLAPGVAAIAFYLWMGVYGVALVAEFWLLANESIDSRQARRLFGPIGAGGVLGGLLLAAAATALGRVVDTVWFLVIAAMLYLVGAALVRRVPDGTEEDSAPPAVEEPQGVEAKGLLDGEYARLLVLLFLVAGIAIGVLDYCFKLVLQDNLTDGGQIASALGIFYSLQGIVSIVAQVGLTGMVLSRFGHRPAANVLPLGLLAGALIAIGVPGAVAAGAIVASRLYELAMRFSMTRTAWEFLYFPLASEVKAKLKRLVDVVVNRSADALAGLLLLAIHAVSEGTLLQLSVVLALLTGLWLILEFRLNRAYVREVDRSLRRLVPETPEKTIELRKVAHADELIDQLASPDRKTVLEAMTLLERIDRSAILESASRLAVHGSSTVRARLLAVVNEAGWTAEDFEPLAPDADRDAFGSMEGQLLEETADERVAVAAAAGRPGGEYYRDRLGELIKDANDDVRRTAIRSVGSTGDERSVEAVVERLAYPRDRRAAHQAMLALGDSVIELLAGRLSDSTTALAARLAAISALEEIRGEESVRALYEAVDGAGQRRVGDAALRALSRIRLSQPDLEFPQEHVLSDLDREIERDGRRLVQLELLREAPDPETRDFMTKVVGERTEASFLRIFRRLSLIYPRGPVMSAYRGLRSGNKRTRAQAIEYLDTLLPKNLARKLLPLVEAENTEERQASARRVFGLEESSLESTLGELIVARDPWLRACGLHVAGHAGKVELLDRVHKECESSDPIVRETARWAAERLA